MLGFGAAAFGIVTTGLAAQKSRSAGPAQPKLPNCIERSSGVARRAECTQDRNVATSAGESDRWVPGKRRRSDGVSLRPMAAADLAAAHALSTELRWPHRATDWEQAFRLGEGLVAERDGQVVGTALRWRWGERHATIGLVIVAPACQGRRIGHRLMSALLDGLDRHSVLLHATAEGRGPLRAPGLRAHRRTAPAPGHRAAHAAGRARSPAGGCVRPDRAISARWWHWTRRRAACRATR